MRRLLSRGCVVLTVLAALAMPGTGHAQQEELGERIRELEERVERLRERLSQQDTAELAELRRMIDALTREIEELRLGQEVVAVADTGLYGLAPAASKVYRVREGVSIGGYGEALYENFADEREDDAPSGKTDQFDFLRAIVYVGYKFSDRLLFNSEIEWEHAATGQAGSVSLEFAYLEYRFNDAFGIRGGMLLPPMGFLNEIHEPPTFLGTERPATENQIIPSTWRENGIGFFGRAADFDYRGYLVNGFDAVGGGSSNAGGFSAGGLRGGRQKGSKAVAEDFGFVGRVDYVGQPGLIVGTSAYFGQSAQNRVTAGGAEIGGETLIWEGHGQYRARGLYLRGLFALATVDDAPELNDAKGLSGPGESIGEQLLGWYLEGGYDVLRPVRTRHELIPYVRFEQLNTQDEVPNGRQADPANDRTIVSLGLAWKPITNIIVKGDFQIHSNEADTGVDQLNAAIGYLF